MNSLVLLIVGAVLLIISYYLPPAPPPIKMILNIVGWICVAVGLILLLFLLLGITIGPVVVPR